jgi:hypothetical protein
MRFRRAKKGITMPLTKDDVAFLESMDTPTVCNVIEIVAPERRGHGYTTRHRYCPFADLPPRVGFAKTGWSLKQGGRSNTWNKPSYCRISSSQYFTKAKGQKYGRTCTHRSQQCWHLTDQRTPPPARECHESECCLLQPSERDVHLCSTVYVSQSSLQTFSCNNS